MLPAPGQLDRALQHTALQSRSPCMHCCFCETSNHHYGLVPCTLSYMAHTVTFLRIKHTPTLLSQPCSLWQLALHHQFMLLTADCRVQPTSMPKCSRLLSTRTALAQQPSILHQYQQTSIQCLPTLLPAPIPEPHHQPCIPDPKLHKSFRCNCC